MQEKFIARARRARKTRAKISSLGINRLCVHRTPKHIYAQIINHSGDVISSASTVEKSLQTELTDSKTGNASAAAIIGRIIGERALAKGVERVAFDRSGFRFHGRIKALANSAREAGLDF